MANILVGISSWSDRSLIESGFYPEDVKTPAERLRFYSQNFPVAEIDSIYHHFPARRVIDLWLNSTPDGFKFDVKAFSLFTQHPTPYESLPRPVKDEYGSRITTRGNVYWHHLPPQATEWMWQVFIGTIEAFNHAGKFGTIVFQFPPWFHPNEENFEYLIHIRKKLSPYRIAVEFRFESWFDETNCKNTLRFLKEQNISLVCVDEPQGFRSSIPTVPEVTTDLGFIRFHGRNSETWEKKGIAGEARFRYLYKQRELKEWLSRIRSMAARTKELHIIFKNKYSDYPVKNARQLIKILGV
jgi:uncharacterized protein YecE (DUF72 family)